MKRHAFLIGLLLFALLLSNASADLFVSYKANVFEGKPGDLLSYNITFYNKNNEDLYINLNFLFASPEFTENPVTLEPYEEKTIVMTFVVPYGVKAGLTYQKLLLFDENGVEYDYNVLLPVRILPSELSPSKYAAIEIKNITLTPSEVDPRKSFTLSFVIDNPVNQVASTVKIESELVKLDKVITVLEGEHEYNFVFNVPNNTKPGNYPIYIKLNFPDYILEENYSIPVLSYANCNITSEETSNIFGRTFEATIFNEGNSKTTCTVADKISSLEKNLIDEVTEGYSLKDGEIVWDIELEPKTSAKVYYKINYIPLLAIPFVIIIFGFLFWYFTRRVDVRKELVDYKLYPGYMDLKIQLRVKNLSGKELRNVVVKDKLPAFVKEIRDYGTIPGKVVKRKGNKYVKWEIDVIKPYEERLFSYKFRTSIEILGRINFPPTVVSYKDERGKKKEEYSNILVVEIE